jgi:hypothetical protein
MISAPQKLLINDKSVSILCTYNKAVRFISKIFGEVVCHAKSVVGISSAIVSYFFKACPPCLLSVHCKSTGRGSARSAAGARSAVPNLSPCNTASPHSCSAVRRPGAGLPNAAAQRTTGHTRPPARGWRRGRGRYSRASWARRAGPRRRRAATPRRPSATRRRIAGGERLGADAVLCTC